MTLAQLLPLQGQSPVILLLHNIRDGCIYTISKERTPSELSMEKSGEQSGIILHAIFLSENAGSGWPWLESCISVKGKGRLCVRGK